SRSYTGQTRDRGNNHDGISPCWRLAWRGLELRRVRSRAWSWSYRQSLLHDLFEETVGERRLRGLYEESRYSRRRRVDHLSLRHSYAVSFCERLDRHEKHLLGFEVVAGCGHRASAAHS